MYDGKNKMMEINHLEFFVSGENIVSYDMGRGWGFRFTQEEQSRNSEINLLYYNTWMNETKKTSE